MLKTKFTKLLLVTTILSLTACGGGGGSSNDDNGSSSLSDGSNNDGVNKAPTVYAGSDKKVQVNTTTTIYGSARDEDGTISSYEWKKGTEVLGTTRSLSYIPTTVGVETITLTVTDDDGAIASDDINLEIVNDYVVNADNILP